MTGSVGDNEQTHTHTHTHAWQIPAALVTMSTRAPRAAITRTCVCVYVCVYNYVHLSVDLCVCVSLQSCASLCEYFRPRIQGINHFKVTCVRKVRPKVSLKYSAYTVTRREGGREQKKTGMPTVAGALPS
jgi:hypothetical protein